MKATEISRIFKKSRGILRGFQKRIGWAFPFPTSVTRPPTSTWEYWGLETIKNITWIFKNFLSPPPVSFWSWLTYAQPERPSLNHEQTAISTMLEGRSLWVQNMGSQSDRLPGWNRQRVQLSFKEGRSGCATVQHNRKDAYGGERNLKKFQDISTTPRTLFFHFSFRREQKKQDFWSWVFPCARFLLLRFCFSFLLLQCASFTNKSNDTHPSPKIYI